MPVLHCNPGSFGWSGQPGGRFHPDGSLRQLRRPSGEPDTSVPSHAARLVVAISRDEDLAALGAWLLTAITEARAGVALQTGTLSRRGADPQWGAQVLLHGGGGSAEEIEACARTVAQNLANARAQDVVLELQTNGLPRLVLGFVPDAPPGP